MLSSGGRAVESASVTWLTNGIAAGSLGRRIVSDEAGLWALRDEWDDLHHRAAAANPFSTWTWCWHWWKAFGRPHVHPRDLLHIVTFDDGTRVRGIVPLIQTTWGVRPLAYRMLRLYGFGNSLTEMSAPLIEDGWEEQVGCALTQYLRQAAREYDRCIVTGLPGDGALARVLGAISGAAGPQSSVPYFLLPLTSSWETLRAGVKRTLKDSLNLSRNTLARESHRWWLETVTEPSELRPALDEFYRLHSARAAAGAEHRLHPDHFATPTRRAFLDAVAHDLARDRQFMIVRLLVDGEATASRLVFTLPGGWYLYHSGFDPVWGRHSVSTLLMAEAIKLAIEKQVPVVNLSTGRDDSKLRWRPVECRLDSLVIEAPVAKSRLLNAAVDRANRHRHRLHVGRGSSPRSWIAASATSVGIRSDSSQLEHGGDR